MNLVISDIALSYQRIPSRSYFEENLVVERDDPPVMVEHPGEVILEAVRGLQPHRCSGLTIIPTSHFPEYGFYLTQLEEQFGDVEITPAGSHKLVDLLYQAAAILNKHPNHLVVISETSQTGNGAISISAANQAKVGMVKIQLPELNPDNKIDFELAGYSGELDRTGIETLADLISNRTDIRAVSLVHPGTHGQAEESLLNLILLALSIKVKTFPAWNPPQRIMPLLELLPAWHFRTHSRPWLATSNDFQRSAILLGKRETSQTWQAVLLSEIPQPAGQIGIRQVNTVDPHLFLINADSEDGLLRGLERIEQDLQGRDSLKTLALNAYTQCSAGGGFFTCSLLASTREGLQKEITHAKTGLAESFRDKKNWASPAGSYFTPLPLGNHELAFVYPGAFNSYPGMGKDLFFSFPGLQEAALEVIPDLSHSLAEDLLYSAEVSSASETQSVGKEGPAEPAKLIESGISLSVLYTMILEQVFNLKPDSAFGYSLGETSMLWAHQVWQDAHESSESWNNSSLFKDQLAGRMSLVRETWQAQELSDDFWGTYILKARLDRVKEACQAEDLVSLTILNTPGEIVIAGEKEACQRVIQALGCHALPMPLNAAIHHPAMHTSLGSFQDLYNIPTIPREDIRFYSAANYGTLSITQENLSRSIAQMTCNPVDFPRLVNQVYEDGARLFIEVGPQKTCSRWIEKILTGKPHAVVPINKRHQSDLAGIFKVLAMLISHGVTLKLDAIFMDPNQKPIGAILDTPSDIPSKPKLADWSPDENITNKKPVNTLAITENLDRISADLAQSQREFLAQQSTLTRALTRMLNLQAGTASGEEISPMAISKVLFSRDQIQAFTNGDHRVCFGDQFSGFGRRRFPRLPNGPLQLLDRVIQVDGVPGDLRAGASLVSEVDPNPDAWYVDKDIPVLPHVALMEIALQPCGFLSAFLGSIQGREEQDLYFRNLDGEATLLYWPDQLDSPIINQVELVSSSSLENVIIQKYNFTLFQGGSPFFQGSSSFGYFPPTMLMDQAGLDDNSLSKTWYELNPKSGSWQDTSRTGNAIQNGKTAHLPVINRLWIAPEGGSVNRGYLYFEEKIPDNAWFYEAHFFQDPVMPGSLGVETMARSLMAAAPTWNIPGNLTWRVKPGSRLSWKYRGQITPDTPLLTLDLHLQSISRTSTNWEICAEGQVWSDLRRIYQVDNLCLESLSLA